MKYHFGIKLAAFLLAAVMLVVMAGSALSIIFLSGYNLYSQSPEEWERERHHDQALEIGNQVLQRYTAQKLGGLTKEQLSYTGRSFSDQNLSDWYGLNYGFWDYWITDLEGNLMENGVKLSNDDVFTLYTFNLNCDYPIHATPEESSEIEETTNWNYRDYYYTETEEHFLYFYIA